jgi:hypothetical protein
MSILNVLRRLTRRQGDAAAKIAPSLARWAWADKSDNEAAVILAWSFREMFKYRGGQGEQSSWNELGWLVSEALAASAHGQGTTQSFLDDPIGLGRNPGAGRTYDRCAPHLAKINDPVITALWEIGTLRALSDMLAHLVLRAEQPGLLRWNTADHFKAKGVDLYAINDAYIETLKARNPA